MKIGEVIVGEEYGAVDEPSRRYSQTTPRQVKVLEIVVVEEKVWARWGGKQQTRNVRRVKIKVLDDKPKGGRMWDTIQVATKGTVLTVEARKLVAPWSDLEPVLRARVEAEQKRAAKEAEIITRLKKVGFKKIGYGDVRVHVRAENRVEIGFIDDHAEKLLKRLEAIS